jgi:hypothetical protein
MIIHQDMMMGGCRDGECASGSCCIPFYSFGVAISFSILGLIVAKEELEALMKQYLQ